jgi:hypothetical protein
VRVSGEEVIPAHESIREIAAAAPRNTDPLSDGRPVIHEQHAPPALAGLRRAHHARRPGADHDDINIHPLNDAKW